MATARILVVDDEPLMERLIRQRFRQHIRQKTYEFVFAKHGLEAFDIVQSNPDIHIVLCDINMPQMDGLTFLGKLKGWDTPLRTIMVSAYGDMPNIRMSMNLGAFDFVTKPVDFDDLEVTIEKTWEVVQKLIDADQVQELQVSNEQLKALDQLKSRLFTNISHELRTPLTIITGMADQIEKQPDQWLDKGLEMIKRNSHGLLHLVNQILDLRKLEMGKLSANMIQSDIVPFLAELVNAFQSYAEYQDVQLNWECERSTLVMDFDQEKIIRILSNLLANAIKYNKAGGQVWVKVQQQTQQQLTVIVQDSGIGIKPDQLPQIFDRFYQVTDVVPPMGHASHTSPGTGIGLTIVKEFVEILQGEIAVDSTYGEGTTFTLSLPITHEAPLVTQPSISPHVVENQTLAGVKKQYGVWQQEGEDTLPHLLVVEDNEDLTAYLSALLAGKYNLSIAKDGQAGIDLAFEQVPDLVISDVMMPLKDGYELCLTLKQDQRTSHIPIVLLTAQADDEARLSGLKMGADAYLTKPFNEEELFIRLDKLHELRQRLQQKYSNIDGQFQGSDNLEDSFMTSIRQAIEQNLDDEYFGIQELCKTIGMSRAQLHRKIKALTGLSTSIYIRSIRLHHAKRLLQNSDLNIAQVAYEVGFRDPKYFSRTFSEAFGQSPKEFRSH